MNKGFIDFSNGNVKLVRDELKKITVEDIPSSKMISLGEKDSYMRKRRIMTRCIADHIGGMTDSFAIQEYHKLYNL